MDFSDAASQVTSATQASDLFDYDDPTKALRRYRELAQALHPDKNPHSSSAEACFAQLTSYWSEYRDRDSSAVKSIVINSRRNAYLVDQVPAYRGELANHYVARYNDAESNECSAILKMPRNPRNSDLMQSEGFALKGIATGGEKRYEALIPGHLESFRHKDTKNATERLVNVLTMPGNLFSLTEVMAAYPLGVDPKDVAWMWRRLFVALGYVHGAGYIHGALFPEHILIEPEKHGLVLIDWCYSVETGTPISVISKQHKHEYPEEVEKKEPATEATDIYMASRCMLGLLGKKSPPMRAFALGCSPVRQASRPTDAFGLKEEYDQLLQRLYGERRFHPFTMPERNP